MSSLQSSLFFHLLFGVIALYFSNFKFPPSQDLPRKNIWLQVVRVPSQEMERTQAQSSPSTDHKKLSKEKISFSNSEVKTNENYDEYFSEIYRRVDQAKYFPVLSKKLGESGEVRVRALLKNTGEVHSVALMSSSGFKRLDEAALETVRNLDRFLPFPDRIKEDHLKIEIPLRYSL